MAGAAGLEDDELVADGDDVAVGDVVVGVGVGVGDWVVVVVVGVGDVVVVWAGDVVACVAENVLAGGSCPCALTTRSPMPSGAGGPPGSRTLTRSWYS